MGMKFLPSLLSTLSMYGLAIIEDKNLMIDGTIPIPLLSRNKNRRGLTVHRKARVPDPDIYLMQDKTVCVGHPATLQRLYYLIDEWDKSNGQN